MSSAPITVLYDGWSLVRQPNAPPALHLLAILAILTSEVKPVLALPEQPPAWLEAEAMIIQPVANTPAGRIRWEQLLLPRMAKQQSTRLIHYFSPSSPLLGPVTSLVSLCNHDMLAASGDRSLPGRVLASLRRGGLARAGTLLWPEDFPDPSLNAPFVSLPQLVHPAFHSSSEARGFGPNGSEDRALALNNLELPETYVLYHGPGSMPYLELLLQAWSWAAGSIGEYYPLVLLGLDSTERQLLEILAGKLEVGASLRALPAVDPHLIPAIYRGCSALFHPAPVTPWGGAVQHALASGKPIAGAESAWIDALVGPAAYLAPPEDARALGAALLTVAIEEQVGEKLASTARQRAAGWDIHRYQTSLSRVYQELSAR